MDSVAPVTLYRAWNPREAHLLVQLLADEGIEARVASDAVEALVSKVPYQAASSPVLVHAGDFARAMLVVERFEETLCGDREPQITDQDRFCYHCGEPAGDNPTACSACGQSLDWGRDGESSGTILQNRWARAFILLFRFFTGG